MQVTRRVACAVPAVVAFAAAAGVVNAHPKTDVSGDWTYVPIEVETVAEWGKQPPDPRGRAR